MRAVAEVTDLAGGYIKQSGGELKDARDEKETWWPLTPQRGGPRSG